MPIVDLVIYMAVVSLAWIFIGSTAGLTALVSTLALYGFGVVRVPEEERAVELAMSARRENIRALIWEWSPLGGDDPFDPHLPRSEYDGSSAIWNAGSQRA